jgi:hypothetical protein
MEVVSKVKDSDGFNAVKKTLERNIVINLVDIIHIKDMDEEQIEEYTGEAMSKVAVLQNAVDEILRDQGVLRTLTQVQNEYGEKETTGDIIGPLQQELRDISKKRGRASDTEEAGSEDGDEASHGRQDGDAGPESDSGAEDEAGEGGHSDSDEQSEDDRADARKRTATE